MKPKRLAKHTARAALAIVAASAAVAIAACASEVTRCRR